MDTGWSTGGGGSDSEQITDEIMRSLRVSAVAKDKTGRVNGIDWDDDGNSLLVSAADESVHIYVANTGELSKTLHSKKYGVSMIKYVNGSHKLGVCASRPATKEHQVAVRIWDLVENRYIRYFPLDQPLCSGYGLQVSGDNLLLCSTDGAVRLQNAHQDQPVKVIKSARGGGEPCAAFDCQGAVFVCYIGEQKLHFFDVNSAEEFCVLDLAAVLASTEHAKSLVFSPDGRVVLMTTDKLALLAVSAFDGQLVQRFDFGEGSGTLGFPCFTPDGAYVICGCPDKTVHIWKTSTGQLLNKLKGHVGVPLYCVFNPRKLVLATGEKDTLVLKRRGATHARPTHTCQHHIV